MEAPRTLADQSVLLDDIELDDLLDTLHDATHALGHLAHAAGPGGTCCADASRPASDLWWDLKLLTEDLETRSGSKTDPSTLILENRNTQQKP